MQAWAQLVKHLDQEFDKVLEKAAHRARQRQEVEPPSDARAAQHEASEASVTGRLSQNEEHRGRKDAKNDVERVPYAGAREAPSHDAQKVVHQSQGGSGRQRPRGLDDLGRYRNFHYQPNRRLQNPPAGSLVE